MAAVHVASFRWSMPRNTMAIRKATACSSATSPPCTRRGTSGSGSSVSARPSRLVRMTVPRHPHPQLDGSSRRRRRRAARRASAAACRRRRAGSRPAVLPQQLAAAAARHHRPAVAGTVTTPPAARRRPVQRRHQPALGAQRQPERGVLDVAARDEASVVDQPRGAHPEARVRRVRAASAAACAAARSRPRLITRPPLRYGRLGRRWAQVLRGEREHKQRHDVRRDEHDLVVHLRSAQ